MSGRTLTCGKYCCIPGCNVTGRTKDINMFGLPSGKKVRGYDTTKWRKDMLKMLYGLRSPNNNQFKQKVEQRKAYICNLHFKDNDIWKGSKKSWLKHGALPTLNLPVKSHPFRHPKARREILKHHLPDKKRVPLKEVQPNSLEQIINCIKNKQLPEHWNVLQCTDNLICVVRPDENFLIDKIKLTIYANSVINLLFYGMPAPSNLISTIKWSKEPFLTSLKILDDLKLCSGYSSVTKATSWVAIHLYSSYASAISEYSARYVSKNCKLGLSAEDRDVCSCCRYQFLHDACNAMIAEERHMALDSVSPSKNMKNFNSCSARRLSTSLQRNRKLVEWYKNQYGSCVDTDVASRKFVKQVMNSCKGNDRKFLEQWWKTQEKLQQSSSNNYRYPASIIRFCMKLFNKSPAVYSLLRSSKILTLPSRQTLDKERNLIEPSTGFNTNTMQDLKGITDCCELLHEKMALIVIDEMKIRECIVYRKHSGDLIGYVDYGSENVTSLCKDAGSVATHVLAVYLRGVTNNRLDRLVAYFPSGSLTGKSLFFLLLKAIITLEEEGGVRVIGIVGDGLSVNHRTFENLSQDDGEGPPFRMVNPCDDKRYIYFILDPPHLMKTTRNNIMNRQLWNGAPLSWQPIRQLILSDVSLLPRRFPHLSREHASPLTHQKMKVKLAAQVLSSTVGIELRKQGNDALSTFILNMDYWFDLMNTGFRDHARKLKPHMSPYKSTDDERLNWLRSFPEYFKNWREKAQQRPDFTEHMLLSKQTEQGIIITCKSMVRLITDCLSCGAPYIITRRCNQDCLESYFGQQRSLGRRNTNPSAIEFGYNNNAIKTRRNVKYSNVTIED